jgi:hypothetical protein
MKAFCKNAKHVIKKEFPNCKYLPFLVESCEDSILGVFGQDFCGMTGEITKPYQNQEKKVYSEGCDFSKYSLLYPGDPGDPFPILSKVEGAVLFPYNKEQRDYFILRRFVSINQCNFAYYLFATKKEESSTNTIKDFRITFCFCRYGDSPIDIEMPTLVGPSLLFSFERRFRLREAAVPKSVQEPVQSKEEKAPSKEETLHTTSSKETNAIPKSSTTDSFKAEDTHPSKIKTSTIVVISSFCVLVVLIIWLLIHKFAK